MQMIKTLEATSLRTQKIQIQILDQKQQVHLHYLIRKTKRHAEPRRTRTRATLIPRAGASPVGQALVLFRLGTSRSRTEAGQLRHHTAQQQIGQAGQEQQHRSVAQQLAA
jgi:hypothetical protein